MIPEHSSLTESRIHRLLEGFSGRRVAIIGDVMLDRYYRGNVTRISPEAPVPIVDVVEETEYPGGAANVGYNLVSLGASPLLLGVAGDDMSGAHLRGLLNRLGIGDEGILVDPERPTTVKTRVIASSQHIVRIDQERKHRLSVPVRNRLLGMLEDSIRQLDALILQDYNKGVICDELIPRAVAMARAHDVPVYVDPKFENFFNYRGVTVFKPNRKEAEDALQRSIRTEQERHKGVQELLMRLGCAHVILTLGSEGMMLASGDEEPALIPTKALQVADVSGAGDTVISTLAVAYAAGATMREAVVVANHAAGIVCEQIGTVPVHTEDLLRVLLEDFGGRLDEVRA